MKMVAEQHKSYRH